MKDYGHYGCIDKRNRRNIKKMVEQGITPVGLGVAIPTPVTAELAAAAGFDYVWLDLEHNIFNPETVANIVRAADSAGMASMARIAQMDLVLPLLDFGMVGFTIPHVRSAAQAKEIVDIIKYAPVGRRGFCTGGRAMRYGAMPFDKYLDEVDQEVTITIMLEDAEGIANCEEILDVPGIDYVLLGPGDISQAMGHIGEYDHPDCVAARNKILAAADKRGIKHAGTGAPRTIAEDKTSLLATLTETIAKHREGK